MLNWIRKIVRIKPIIVTSVTRNENCFCGAAFSVTLPVVSPDPDLDPIAAVDQWRDNWHRNHWHQINPQMGDLVGVGDVATTSVVQARGLGFPGVR